MLVVSAFYLVYATINIFILKAYGGKKKVDAEVLLLNEGTKSMTYRNDSMCVRLDACGNSMRVPRV